MNPDTEYEERNAEKEKAAEEKTAAEKERSVEVEEEPEEEWTPETLKPIVKILISLGLVLFAAIFTGILWNVTHSGGGGDDGNDQVVSRDGEGQEPDGAVASDEETGSGAEEASGEDVEAGIEAASGAGVGSDDGTASDEEAESGIGASGESAGSGNMTASESGTGAAAGEGVGFDNMTVSESGAGSNTETPAGEGTEAADGTENGIMAFTECQDTVTPKEKINLRSAPSTAQADNVVVQAVNGEVLTRTGINSDTGWSRLDYNGQTLYAVSGYLTTDLAYQPPVPTADSNSVNTKDGRTIIFTDCDDRITPKMYVNLRVEPSTSEGDTTVYCRLENGETVHRTGVSEGSAWSRVEYDGQVLYVVTSYMYVVEEAEAQEQPGE